jgi:signal transduction histidine kinase
MDDMQWPRSERSMPWARASARVGSWLVPAALAVLMLVGWTLGAYNAAPSSTPEGASLWPLALAFGVGALLVLLAGLLGWWAGQTALASGRHEVLQEARHDAQALGQVLEAWLWRSDARHHVVQWQAPQAAAASSWAGHAAGQTLWERFGTADALASPGLAALQSAMEGHEALTGLQIRGAARGAGEPRQWVLHGLPRQDAQGRFVGYFGLARPLADAPAAAAASADGVNDGQGDQPSPLAREAQAFSFTVSHDLRAPLRVVEGFTRILKEDYGSTLDRVGNDHLDRVLGASARMNGMIDALLALAQLSSQPLAVQPVNLSQLAGFVVEDLRRSSPQREVQVQVDAQMSAQGDPRLLRLVLENLLGNAWKYSGRVAAPQIRLQRQSVDGETVYTVADNGAGFDMRYADRLFGLFQRLHSASDFEGSGVGLASVKRIVERHGGRIWAESELGQGARFHFTLGPPRH